MQKGKHYCENNELVECWFVQRYYMGFERLWRLISYGSSYRNCYEQNSNFGRYGQHESFSDIEEFHMKKILIQYVVCALAVVLMVPLAPLAQAQPAGIQAAFAKDAGTLSDKFTGLARIMSGKYDWKPGQGVRSVGDVFNLIVKENGLLVGVLSGTPNTEAKPKPITDPEKLQNV
jgi:hypothetical protein